MNLEPRERIRARVTGVVLMVGGVGALSFGFYGGPMPRREFAGLVALGASSCWFGAGLAAVPLPDSVFLRIEQGAAFVRWFRALPPFWKVWMPLSVAVLLGSLLAANFLAP